MTVALIGLRGSGKSTVGRQLARRLLRIARADYAACAALLDARGVRFANAAFHGQQGTEKALKAIFWPIA